MNDFFVLRGLIGVFELLGTVIRFVFGFVGAVIKGVREGLEERRRFKEREDR